MVKTKVQEQNTKWFRQIILNIIYKSKPAEPHRVC